GRPERGVVHRRQAPRGRRPLRRRDRRVAAPRLSQRLLSRAHPRVSRGDGSVLTRYPEAPALELTFAARSPWMQLVRRGAPAGVQTVQEPNGERSLAALR